jgi:hypothetical protein
MVVVFRRVRGYCPPYVSGPGVNFINMIVNSFYAQKCFGAQVLFHQQHCAQLFQYTQLEVTPHFLLFTLYAMCH